MNQKIVRLHTARRNPDSITRAEIRELRRMVAEQDHVVADLIMEVRALRAGIAPPAWGFDPRDTPTT